MSRILPAGHASSIASRAHAAEPTSDLEHVFLEKRTWILEGHTDHTYIFASGFLKHLTLRAYDVHNLLLKHNEISTLNMDAFVAAAYARCKDTVIIYDLDTPRGCLGYRLPTYKLFINTGRTDSYLGLDSEGIVVNCGTTGDNAGDSARGIVINAGMAGKMFGRGLHGGISIALREPESYQSCHPQFLSRPIRHDTIPDNLKAYLEELTEHCRGSVEEIHERYGSVPARQINDDIRKLLSGVYM